MATGQYIADESRRVRTKEASATPIAFRDALIDMARTAHTRSDAGQAKEGKPVISAA